MSDFEPGRSTRSFGVGSALWACAGGTPESESDGGSSTTAPDFEPGKTVRGLSEGDVNR
jgi:hypothetical protein